MAEYSIRINGVEESINNVKQLIEQLNNLEASISTLENKSIKVNVEGVVQTAVTTSTASSGSRTGELQQEDALLKQIATTEQKIADARREEYKDLIQQKDVLKEVTEEAKKRAAEEKIASEGYANTMAGMKAELKDLKRVINSTDLGDEKFQSLVERANKLQLKLKEIEYSYSQFGRNVGNYPSAAEGFKELALEVAGTTREFDNAKQALAALKKERDTLAVKRDQGLILSEEELQRFNELVQLVPQLQSSIQDAGKPMDNLMDSMESFVALASAGKGLSAFFGLDGGEIDKTMKDLLALQNALKGIQTIQKQLQTVEGIGKWFKAGSDAVDKFTSKLFGLEKTTKTVTTAEKAQAAATSTVANAEKAATAGAAAQTAANGALTTSLTTANVAAKALSFTLKSIGIGLVLTAIAAAVEGIQWIGEKIADSMNSAEKNAERLENTLETLKDTYSQLLDYNSNLFDRGELDYNTYMLRQLKLINEELEKEIRLRREAEDEDDVPSSYGERIETSGGQYIEGKLVKDAEEAKEVWAKFAEDAKKNEDEILTAAQVIMNDFVGRAKKAMNDLEKAQENVKKGVKGADKELEKAKKTVKELNDEMYNTSGRSIIDVLNSINVEEIRNKYTGVIGIMKNLRSELDARELEHSNFLKQLAIDLLPDTERQIAQVRKRVQDEIKEHGTSKEIIKDIEKRGEQEIQKIRDEANKKRLAKQKEYAKKVEEQENELNRIRIARMKEGLNKQLAQLEEERRLKLSKLKIDSELYLETNAYYDERIEDAKKKHAEQIVKIEEDMYSKLHKLELDNLQKQLDLQERGDEERRRRFESGASKKVEEGESYGRMDWKEELGIQSYGIEGKNMYSTRTQERLKLYSQTDKSELMELIKAYISELRTLAIFENKYATKKAEIFHEIDKAEREYLQIEKDTNEELAGLEQERTEITVEEFDKREYEIRSRLDKAAVIFKEQKERYEEELNDFYDEAKIDYFTDRVNTIYDTILNKYGILVEEDGEQVKKLGENTEKTIQDIARRLMVEESYTDSLTRLFSQRMSVVEKHWAERKAFEEQAAEDLYEKEQEVEETAYQKRLEDLGLEEKAFRKQLEQLEKHLEELNGVEREEHEIQYKERKELYQKLYGTDEKAGELELALQEEHVKNLQALEEKKNEKLRKLNQEYFQDALQELRDFQSATEQLAQKQPVMNTWGIINLKETKKNNDELRNAYSALISELNDKRRRLNDRWNEGLIDKDVYQATLRELDSFASNLGDKLDAVGTNFGDFWQGIDTWVQQVGQTFNSIYQSLAEITNNYYQGEIDKQQEYIDKYAELLQKQQEKTQEYANNVNSIENELANARGSRRQHLIDQLNAELAAQRASLAQEKQMEAEQKKAEEKRRDLENEQARKRKKADEIQAYINALMAVSMAAVNKWPIPALPMIAMATAVGAAQVAAIKSQPVPTYGEGGVIQGKSHAAGGVKVLGGRAEVEGGEFITNKRTTINNVELLEYINTKKRKLNIDDFIDFYSGKAVKKNIQTARTKFANGGQIPTLRNDIDLTDRMLTAFEDYSNRPVVVEVQEIMDKSAAITNVEVLAGLHN